MNILGIHGGVTVNQHDAAAALIIDGSLICSVEEERLARIKTATGMLPIRSIQACLKEANLSINEIDLIVLPGNTYANIISRTKEWLVHHFGYSPKIEAINHQMAHISSAFYHSNFDNAMCLSFDAYGDGISGATAIASKEKGIEILETIPATNSLGIFYAVMTNFLGFKHNEDEYKVMGLAPYGKPTVDLSFFCQPTKSGYKSDASYYRSRTKFSTTQYEPNYSQKLEEKIGRARRNGELLSEHYKNVAASAQDVLEKCVLSKVSNLHSITKNPNLCLAGGVALNCSANHLISKLPFIKNFFVQPAASDRGLALGCALYAAVQNNEKLKEIKHVFYGPTIKNVEIENAIKLSGVKARYSENLCEETSKFLLDGKIIAWYQGRSEFGPRALGARSILADPGFPEMKNIINKKVKFREEFRPFAPSVLEEKYKEIFDLKEPSPYMTIACNVKKEWRSKIPATTHVNNTARVQTVNQNIDPLFHYLIKSVENLNGSPVVLNTSFNIKGQPIVETPLEAISTFFGSGIDVLVMGNFIVTK